MGYADNLKSTLICVENNNARREAELNTATIQVVNTKAALKAARKAEESALKTIKTAERVVKNLKEERHGIYGVTSRSPEAIALGDVVENALSELEALKKDQAEVLSLESKARELGQMAEFEKAAWAVANDLRINAEKLDASWPKWHKAVEEPARKALKEANWYRRMAEARKNLENARKEHLKVKGDIVTAIERRNNAINRLNKLMEGGC